MLASGTGLNSLVPRHFGGGGKKGPGTHCLLMLCYPKNLRASGIIVYLSELELAPIYKKPGTWPVYSLCMLKSAPYSLVLPASLYTSQVLKIV